MSETTFDEQLTELQQAFDALKTAIIAAMIPALEIVCKWYEDVQRLHLGARLSGWLPNKLAYWFADHWPARWLPHPKFDEVE